MSKKLTQCEISSAELEYGNAVLAFDEANKELFKSVEKLINMLAKLDENLLSPKRHIIIRYIDGESVTNFNTRHIEFEEDDTIIVVCEDDFGEETTFDLYDLSNDEIRCLGGILFDNYQEKYGKRMTYKDMVEVENLHKRKK